MKMIARSMMILCAGAALALLPACYTTGTSGAKCAKCGSSACVGKCDAKSAQKACPKCGKAGCTTCR